MMSDWKMKLSNWLYFTANKNLYSGQRGFVVCNGPSLLMKDLDSLRSEISIASNKIFLAYPHTDWRPTFHTIADALLIRKVKESLWESVSETHTPESSHHRMAKVKTHSWKDLGRCSAEPARALTFSNNMAKGAYAGGTVTFVNLQLAAHLGLNPIYLIGADHLYLGEGDVTPNYPVKVGDQQNHFVAGYRSKGEFVNPADTELMDQAYLNVRYFSDQSGVKIYNASRGGQLNVFDRVDLGRVVHDTAGKLRRGRFSSRAQWTLLDAEKEAVRVSLFGAAKSIDYCAAEKLRKCALPG